MINDSIKYNQLARNIERSVRSGKHVIRHSDGVQTAKNLEVMNIEYLEDFTRFLEAGRVNDGELKRLNHAREGYERLKYYVSECEFVGGEPILEFRTPLTQKDVIFPRLDGLTVEDSTVIVNMVKQVGKRFKIKGMIDFETIRVAKTMDFFQYWHAGIGRKYQFEEDLTEKQKITGIPLYVHRYPSVLCLEINDEVENLAGLGYSVLCQRLEAYTTQNLIRTVNVSGTSSIEKFEKIIEDLMFQESFLAKTITRAWMMNHSIPFDRILRWRRDESQGIRLQEEEALEKVLDSGPELPISYYGSSDWNFQSLINGDYGKSGR